MTTSTGSPTSFNGAATCSLRKGQTNFHLLCQTLLASMGPQLVRCGKKKKGGSGRVGGAASMGPQLVRCGKRCASPPGSSVNSCFNGAATCSLRKGSRTSYASLAHLMLQWGRNLFVAERSPPSSRRTADWSFNGAATCSLRKAALRGGLLRCVTMLQWGRNLFVAESVLIRRGYES